MGSRSTADRLATAAGNFRWLAASLFVPFAIVSILLLQTIRDESARRSIEGRVLTDYATTAAREIVKRSEAALHMGHLEHMFRTVHQPLHDSAAQHQPVDPRVLLDPSRNPVRAFRFDVATDQLTIRGHPADEAMVTRLRTVVAALVADTIVEPHRLLIDTTGVAPRVLWFFLERPMLMRPQRPGPTRHVYGVETAASVLGPIISAVLAGEPLLPPALLAPPYSSDALRVAVRSPGGKVIWRADSSAAPGPTGSDTLPAYLGRAIVQVDAGPRLAAVLRIGRPSSLYLPALWILMALSAGVGLIGMVQLRKAREMAELRERFVANVSHELRTPLTQMSMFAEMLEQSRVRSAEEARHYASVIHRETRRLTTLVESVLRFSRSNRNGVAVQKERCDLRAEIDDAVSFFQPVAAGKDVSIDVDVLPGIAAAIDTSAFRQIMLNILDNAVKYGPSGQRVSISAATKGSEAVITISDEGPGIPATDRDRVFEPYVRLQPTGAPRTAGAGIGMAVVRDLVLAHGGRVWIDDAPRGAAISFSVPLHGRQSAPVDPVAAGASA
jgi:signal transduction histidine kinase